MSSCECCDFKLMSEEQTRCPFCGEGSLCGRCNQCKGHCPCANFQETVFTCLEAFKLIEYYCGHCKTTEVIWNARDCVAIAELSCAACKPAIQYNPYRMQKIRAIGEIVLDYEPTPLARVFINNPGLATNPLRIISGDYYEELML